MLEITFSLKGSNFIVFIKLLCSFCFTSVIVYYVLFFLFVSVFYFAWILAMHFFAHINDNGPVRLYRLAGKKSCSGKEAFLYT